LEETAPADEVQEVPVAMGAARHKFLLLGIVLAAIIVAAMVWLNEAAKEESKFAQAVGGVNLKSHSMNNPPGLAYQPPPKASATSQINSTPAPTAKPAKISSPAPTTPVPPHE